MIIDIVLIILVVLTLIYGIYKGFAGVLLGFIGTIVIAVGVGVGLFFLAPNVMYKDAKAGVSVVEDDNGVAPDGYTDFFMLLYKPISKHFIDSEDAFMSAELIDVDGMLQLKLMSEDGENYTTVKFSVAVSELIPFFNSSSKEEDNPETANNVASENGSQTSDGEGIQMLDDFITKYGCEGLTVGHAIGAFLTLIVWCAILWHIMFYVLIIIKIIIRRLIYRALDKHSVASKIDRALGAVVSVAVMFCVIWLVLSLVGVLSAGTEFGDSYNQMLSKNPISNFLVENSILGGSEHVTTPPNNENEELAIHTISNIIKN